MIKRLIKKGFCMAARKESHAAPRCGRVSVTVLARNNMLKIGPLLGVLDKADTQHEGATAVKLANMHAPHNTHSLNPHPG